METITSRENAKIKYACAVRDSEKQRAADGLFFAEGPKLCLELAKSCTPRAMYATAAALAACYRNCLELARAHRIDSVDFPSISTGVYGYPMAQAASVALKAIMEDLRTHDHPCRVRMVCHTEDAANIYRQTYNLWYAATKEDRL